MAAFGVAEIRHEACLHERVELATNVVFARSDGGAHLRLRTASVGSHVCKHAKAERRCPAVGERE